MAKLTYKPSGVCSRAIHIETENGIITHIDFEGGCAGNTKGVAALATGMRVEDAIKKLSGIQCFRRNVGNLAALKLFHDSVIDLPLYGK